MSDPRIRTLKIKAGVAKRLAKEKVMYQKETEQERERLQKFKDEGKDEHDVRKQEEVLHESLMMIPDSQKRLQAAYDDLKNVIQTESDLAETTEYKEAVAMLEQTTPILLAK